MGVDIYMSIVKNGEYIKENIFDGRNSEWFANLQGCGESIEYNYLPIHYDIPENAPEELREANRDSDYYGFNYISVADFKLWFRTRWPHLDAGWVTTFEKWQYDKKGIVPKVKHYLDKEDNLNDYHFIEIENKYDCSEWLYDYLTENNIEDDAYIVYYFDC